MKQLVMHWLNDGQDPVMESLPEKMTISNFASQPDALTSWLDIIRFMWKEEKTEIDASYYQRFMLDRSDYDDRLCFFFSIDNVPVATLTIICNHDTKEGRIHMVGCKPECRGHGVGTIMAKFAVYILKKEGMQRAALVTDDWRIPAIKTYLKTGFVPDMESEPDYYERWNKVLDHFKK